MARTRKGRSVDGILVLDKPAGPTSNQALQRVKWLFDAAKAGHTGSLDPLATGVLPICFGEATKFTQFLLEADKTYASTFRLGVTTTTGDRDGEVLEEQSAAGVSAARVEAALTSFRGVVEQIPSMYSALKQGGQPLYKLARQGIEVERTPRRVTIHSYELCAFRGGECAELDVVIRCSKGTYIRTLAEDLGRQLGCGAHVTRLRRLASGPFGEADAVTLDGIDALRSGSGSFAALDALLRPVDAAVADRLALELPENLSWYFLRGQAVALAQARQEASEGDLVRVFRAPGEFLGVGEVLDDGRIKPHRLVAGAQR
ncbi:MAG: tRNA pseudouridine(55) synthase TruB [Porticoccaceae bacterium]